MWRFRGLSWLYNELQPGLEGVFGATIASIIMFILFLCFLAIVGGTITFLIKIVKDIF